MDDEDYDIYGADPTPTETPDQPAAQPEPKPINPIPEEPVPEPQIDLPIVSIDVTGLNWWITEQEIRDSLSPIGQVVDLNMEQSPTNGKFVGHFDCGIKTKAHENDVIEQVKEIQFGGNFPHTVALLSEIKTKEIPIHETKFFEQSKPAPMLYEDPTNPIPKYLLPFEQRQSENLNTKLEGYTKRMEKPPERDNSDSDSRDNRDSYDSKESRSRQRSSSRSKSRERDRSRDRDRDRERRSRDRDHYRKRGDYDYDYSDEKDYRRDQYYERSHRKRRR